MINIYLDTIFTMTHETLLSGKDKYISKCHPQKYFWLVGLECNSPANTTTGHIKLVRLYNYTFRG